MFHTQQFAITQVLRWGSTLDPQGKKIAENVLFKAIKINKERRNVMILPGFCVSTMFTSRSNKAWSVKLEVILITLKSPLRGSTASHRLGFRATTKNGMTQIRVGPRDDSNDAKYYSMSQGKILF